VKNELYFIKYSVITSSNLEKDSD